MSWELQINKLQNDLVIKNYFLNVNLIDFIKMYIQVDSILHSQESNCNNIPNILQQLRYIEKCISQNDYIDNKDTIITNILGILESQLSNDKNHLNSIITNSLDNNPKLNNINNVLTTLNNNFTGANSSAKKGEVAENILYNNLIDLLPSYEVVNTSNIPNSGDIHIIKDNKPTILIDSKHFQRNVPKIDLDKFYDDCQLNNSCGILCNAFSGIANRDNFEIDIQDKRILLFINNHQFNNKYFDLGIKIIYHIHNIIKNKNVNVIEIEKNKFQHLKTEYNYFRQSFNQYIEIIKQNIKSLELLNMKQLEQFFKRSNFNNHEKLFNCHLCGTGISSSKALNSHMKNKHDIEKQTKIKDTKKKEIEIKEIEIKEIENEIKEKEKEENKTENETKYTTGILRF